MELFLNAELPEKENSLVNDGKAFPSSMY